MTYLKRVSAAETLHTLELYFELQSASKAAAKLGICKTAVLKRLMPFGVVPRPSSSGPSGPSVEEVNDMVYISQLKQYLVKKAEWEKRNPFSVNTSGKVPAIELLSTVGLYFQLNSIQKVADQLELSYHAVELRLNKLGVKTIPRGRNKSRARDFNDPSTIERIMKQLHDQAEVEIYRAG